jgi:uncharacterized SAM-binding protein YcdF (DUF218 family)
MKRGKYWQQYRRLKLLVIAILAVVGLLFASLSFNVISILISSDSLPADAFLVLGGSINREIYVARLAKQYPNTPILISQGSDDPCILLIFQREGVPIDNVWLEKCAESTFGNFFFTAPILKTWKVKKVRLITSQTHLPRASLMAKLILGSQGITVDLDIAPETGIPGNDESVLKTTIDVTRSFFWALIARVIKPSCSKLTELTDVDLAAWEKKGFVCERQAGLKVKN